jgi:signal transduction histidine kinase
MSPCLAPTGTTLADRGRDPHATVRRRDTRALASSARTRGPIGHQATRIEQPLDELEQLRRRNAELETALATRDAADARRRADEHKKLVAALRSLEAAQAELTQSQKLTAIGQLAAGVAHEINTPIQYVGDNLTFLQKVFHQVVPVLEAAAAAVDGDAEAAAKIREQLPKLKLGRLVVQVPRALEQSREGVARVSTIVGAMKQFSHPSGGEKAEVDLSSAIESTITIARNEWKYVADVDMDIPEDMPPIVCLRDELNQVILNLVINASHAIAAVVGDGSKGRGLIRVTARIEGGCCEIRVSDTGSGIADAHKSRVFDPFFTTKPVGRGTGQGLAIAYNVIVEKHGGTISFESEVGRGTTFIIRIPHECGANAKGAA